MATLSESESDDAVAPPQLGSRAALSESEGNDASEQVSGRRLVFELHRHQARLVKMLLRARGWRSICGQASPVLFLDHKAGAAGLRCPSPTRMVQRCHRRRSAGPHGPSPGKKAQEALCDSSAGWQTNVSIA